MRNALANEFAACSPPPPRLASVRVGHCIAGLANSNRPYYSRPLLWEETWQSLARWLYALRRAGMQSGVFMVLDFTNYPSKQVNVASVRRSMNGSSTKPTDVMLHEAFPSTSLPRAEWPKQGDEARALEALRLGAEHVEVADFAPGVCRRAAASSDPNAFKCTCGVARASFPRFFEQLGKHAQCLAMLTRHEADMSRAGGASWQYDFVTKLRPDPNVAVEYWMRPAWLREQMQSMRATAEGRRTVLVAPWLRPWRGEPWSNGACYSWSDWWAMMPRGMARRYLNATNEMSCGWLQCAELAYGGARRALSRHGACLYNERLLVEWLLAADGAYVQAAPKPTSTAASGWCERAEDGADASTTMPWLKQLASRVRGVGKEIMIKADKSTDTTAGPIGSGRPSDERLKAWHRPQAMRAC